jgi:nucleoside-diphosphate-sugar epimerase
VAARDAGVRRFVFASSSSVYGESQVLPKVESMATAPISPYGLQKLAGEEYCRIVCRLYRLPTVALRYFNVFGPRQDPASEYAAVVPRFVTAVRDGVAPTIFGDGEQTRDFTFVSNVVDANLAACGAPEAAAGSAYNIACGEAVSLNALLARVAGIAGRAVTPRYAEARPGDIRHSLAGIELARARLGYAPAVSLGDGLRRLWDAGVA